MEPPFGEVNVKGTANTQRKRLRAVVRNLEQHLFVNGPWHYESSAIYYTAEVTAAVQVLLSAQTAPPEISQLAA